MLTSSGSIVVAHPASLPHGFSNSRAQEHAASAGGYRAAVTLSSARSFGVVRGAS
jgi:ascorbate-specific PTS system EIIC-type component UlaA